MSDDLACIEAIERVTDHLERASSVADAGRLERHVESCPGCGEYFAQMRAVAGSLRGLGRETVSAGTRAALIAAFRNA